MRNKIIGFVIAFGLLATLLYSQLGPAVRIPDGSDSAPGLAFFRNSITGIYLGGSRSLGIAAESLLFEGATADGSEMTLAVTDPTADYTYNLPDQSADTYFLHASPDADIGTGFLANPMFPLTAGVPVPVDATIGDLEMYVQRFYLPFPLTVGAIYGINEAGTNTGSGNGGLGAAIYEDVDATGSVLFSCIVTDPGGDGAIDCNGTDVLLQPGWYRLGLCGEDVDDEMWGGALQVSSLLATTWNTLALTQVMIGEAAEDCTGAGVVPSFTGALEDSATEVAFWIIASDN